jgi:hypothetical protein
MFVAYVCAQRAKPQCDKDDGVTYRCPATRVAVSLVVLPVRQLYFV